MLKLDKLQPDGLNTELKSLHTHTLNKSIKICLSSTESLVEHRKQRGEDILQVSSAKYLTSNVEHFSFFTNTITLLTTASWLKLVGKILHFH